MKTKISNIGRRGKTVLAVLIAVMFIGVASAAIIPHFGRITTTATVDKQAVEISADGTNWNSYNEPIEHTIPHTSPGGETFCFAQWVRNSASIPVNVTFERTDGYVNEVNTTYYEILGYAETFSVDIEGSDYDLEVTVEDGDCWVTWTFDFPVENFTGNGNLNVGLIIALDGNGSGPAFQIHNTDSNEMTYTNGTPIPAGTWVMSPWGPTITDGWFGWHSGNINTPVADLYWVDATGNRNVPHGDGILQIKISKCKLGETIHWAASPTVGSGFAGPYDVTMQIPTAFGWTTPIVDMTVPNYIEANLMTKITNLILQPYTQQVFGICYTFDLHIGIGTYYLTTTVDATEST